MTNLDAAAELPEVLTVDEVAAILKVNRKTVYRAIRRRAIPGVRRIGRSVRISSIALLGWLRGQPLV